MTTQLAIENSIHTNRSRFMFGEPAVDDVIRSWLAADMRGAQLSPLFRAYYLIRSLIPLSVRQRLQRLQNVQPSERWCFPDAFVEELARALPTDGDGLGIVHPWPDGGEFAFVLTHDIETAEGQRNVAEIADMEELLGFRSSWNFVPFKYPIDYGLMRDLLQRGFEIGVHGYNHDGRLFSSRRIFDSRVGAINETLKAWGAVGFRAPMVHRNLAWLQDLNILYDASCFDADPYQAMPGGVGSIWPLITGRFVELPYTLPQDHTLFIALGERSSRVWQAKLEFLKSLSGMSLVITHPDYLDSTSRIDCYRDLLAQARDSDGMWHALPRDVAKWWRDRSSLTVQRDLDGSLQVAGNAADRARAACIRPAETLQQGRWTIEACQSYPYTTCGAGHDH